MSPKTLTILTVVFAVVAAALAFSAALVKHNIEGRWDIVPITGGVLVLALAVSAWSRYQKIKK